MRWVCASLDPLCHRTCARKSPQPFFQQESTRPLSLVSALLMMKVSDEEVADNESFSSLCVTSSPPLALLAMLRVAFFSVAD